MGIELKPNTAQVVRPEYLDGILGSWRPRTPVREVAARNGTEVRFDEPNRVARRSRCQERRLEAKSSWRSGVPALQRPRPFLEDQLVTTGHAFEKRAGVGPLRRPVTTPGHSDEERGDEC